MPENIEIILEQMRARRSIRRYQNRPVPRELIDRVLDAARWAPSAHNRQPWSWVVIERAKTKHSLAAAMGERLRADLESDGVARQVIDAQVSRSYARITNAPALILACMTRRELDSYSDARRKQAEYIMATQSVAMAVQNLLLAAHTLGLGACWMCAPLFVPDTVGEILRLEPDWEPQALITLGYPAESKTKTRAPIDSVVRYLDTDSTDEHR